MTVRGKPTEAEGDRSDALSEQTWVLTGAAGGIGSSLRAGLAQRVRELRLVDVVEVEASNPGEVAMVADVRGEPAIRAACGGADGIIHLAGIPDEADFHDLAEVNITGTFHVLEAARLSGARRVVLASSNHVTGLYPTTTAVDAGMVVRPDSLYGVTKVAGEALGRMYAEKFGLQVACIRIGSFQATPQDVRQLSTWLSPRDCLAAVVAAMTAPGLSFTAFYGVSRNTRRWWDLTAGEALGFSPQDDAEDFAADLSPGDSDDGLPQGGAFAAPAYTSDWQRAPAPDH
jgi:uronate dehydrogenase